MKHQSSTPRTELHSLHNSVRIAPTTRSPLVLLIVHLRVESKASVK